MSGRRRQTIVIALDAAERTLVEELLGDGDLPVLGSLLGDGTLGRVESPASIGSGAVWPTFATGTSPVEHGIHSLWAWNPARMRSELVNIERLQPFWAELAREGYRVTVLDLPFSRPLREPGLTVVSEWGPHDSILGRCECWPDDVSVAVERAGEHPYGRPPVHDWKIGAGNDGRARFIEESVEGLRQRGALARELVRSTTPDCLVLGVTELHRASHMLWHTRDASHPRHADAVASPAVADGLRTILRTFDQELGELIAVVEDDAAVLVCSMHGMRSSAGVPDQLLDPVLEAWGFAATRRSGRKLGGALSTVREVARKYGPGWLRSLYHSRVPVSVSLQVSGPPGAPPPYDWARTRAFRMPTDQHGWLRVNLIGRESAGTVLADDYERTCAALEEMLRELVTTDGLSVVRDVVRPNGDAASAARSLLPDVIAHFNPEAMRPGLDLREPPVAVPLRAGEITGEHSPEGLFVLGSGSPVPAVQPVLRADGFAGLVRQLLQVGTEQQ